MGARRKGRELAVQALYQVDLTGEASAEALRLFFERAEASASAKEFAAVLIDGVRAEQSRLDELITQASRNWRFDRLSRVDLNVLRLATYELSHTPKVPTSVVIDEAIEIARRFGTQESAEFVNGILDQIAGQLGVKEDPTLRRGRGDG